MRSWSFCPMNPDTVFDRERIYERVCGYDAEGDSRVITGADPQDTQ